MAMQLMFVNAPFLLGYSSATKILVIIVFRILAISIGQESFFLNHCRAPSPYVLVICNSETFGEQSNTKDKAMARRVTQMGSI
jgi:hypothetical protein